MVIIGSLDSQKQQCDWFSNVNSWCHPKVSGLLQCLIKHVGFGYFSINHSLQKSHVFVTCCVCEKLQFFYDQFYTAVQFWQTQLSKGKKWHVDKLQEKPWKITPINLGSVYMYNGLIPCVTTKTFISWGSGWTSMHLKSNFTGHVRHSGSGFFLQWLTNPPAVCSTSFNWLSHVLSRL